MTVTLAVPATVFVGREREIERLTALMASRRLVTLIGAGGVGKTRLALEAARREAAHFADGATWVDLAAVQEPAALASALAAALALQPQPGQAVAATVLEQLRPRAALLVLDNCEHLIDTCAEWVAQILVHCPGVRILATSREALQVGSETTYPVPPLAVPHRAEPLTSGHVARFEAVGLFVDRAQSVDPYFVLTDANAPLVAEICWQLDGMPLALELAAARLRVLSPAELLEGLTDRFQLLGGLRRDAPPRHATLRSLVDWSYDLMSVAERLLFRRVSIFAGGFTLEAARAVAGREGIDPGAVLHLLQQLADKSVIFTERPSRQPGRYRMLETLRLYGLDRLQESGEHDRMRARHLAWCLTLGEHRAERLFQYSAEMSGEEVNLRMALDTALQDPDRDGALRVGVYLALLLMRQNRLAEAQVVTERVLNLPGSAVDIPECALAHDLLGTLLYRDDRGGATEHLNRALGVAERVGASLAAAWALLIMGNVAAVGREPETARSLWWRSYERHPTVHALANLTFDAQRDGRLADAEALVREYGNVSDATGLIGSWTLARAQMAVIGGDLATARNLVESALAGPDLAVIDWFELRMTLALVSYFQGRLDECDGILRAELGSVLRTGAVTNGLGEAVQLAMWVLARRGFSETACHILGVARASHWLYPGPPWGRETARVENHLRKVLGPRAEQIWADAVPLASADLLREAAHALLHRSGGNRSPVTDAAPPERKARAGRTHTVGELLTPREREVAELVAQGLTNRHIAQALHIAEGTVGIHVTHILAKLDVRSRWQVGARLGS